MLTALVLFLFLHSTLVRVMHHGEPKVWRPSSFLPSLLRSTWNFIWIAALWLVLQAQFGIEHYIRDFYANYHAWAIGICFDLLLLIPLWAIKEITYEQQLATASIPVAGTILPVENRNMMPSLIWNSAFYAAIFFNPTFPFLFGLSNLFHRR